MAAPSKEVADIQRQINELLESTKGGKNEKLRHELKDMANTTLIASKGPNEALLEFLYSNINFFIVVCMLRKGVVHTLVSSGRPMTADELSANLSIEKHLLVRLMRTLTALGIFDETDEYTYAANDTTRALATPPWEGAMEVMYQIGTTTYVGLPDYLEKTGWKDPNTLPGIFEHGHNGKGFFDYMVERPELMTHFNNFMSIKRANRPDWFQVFPAEEIVMNGASTNPEDVLFVDVGGSEGHDIDNFAKAYPDLTGKLVLQDLPEVVGNIEKQGKTIDKRIIPQGYSFWNPQPVKGARAYYMRSILHDWPDDQCRQILKNHAQAMTPGYSKILLSEWVLPTKGVPVIASQLDLILMGSFSSQERTEDEWRALVESAGLKVTKVYKQNEAGKFEGMIEVML